MATKKPKKELVTCYKVFVLSQEGHFQEPLRGGWEGESHLFNNYGYDSIEEANQDILEKGLEYQQYIILPFIKIAEKQNE